MCRALQWEEKCGRGDAVANPAAYYNLGANNECISRGQERTLCVKGMKQPCCWFCKAVLRHNGALSYAWKCYYADVQQKQSSTIYRVHSPD